MASEGRSQAVQHAEAANQGRKIKGAKKCQACFRT